VLFLDDRVKASTFSERLLAIDFRFVPSPLHQDLRHQLLPSLMFFDLWPPPPW
jgi:hypothetical protein